MHSGKVQYVSVSKHLLSYVIGYNINNITLTNITSNVLEKCNRKCVMDIR